ncbi:MAG: energy-coupling factor ABC transporter permease [Zoogloeaceae bacterium]|jgi:uncharacterized membrane protein|nr:energy-coupling factor ABC transporter permease [Zoogloeaceae bacterium]
MNFDATLLAEHVPWLIWLSWLLWLPCLIHAIRRAPWRTLLEQESRRFNLWMAIVILLVFFWGMKAGIKPGLDLHLTGIMLFTLLFDVPLAFIGFNLVLAGLALTGALSWSGFALDALMTAGIGVILARLIRSAVERFFPRHFFIFIFLQCFFGAALVVAGIGLAASLLYAATGIYTWTYLAEEYLPYYILLGFSEAWLSGMLLTLMTVYYPTWVVAYDQHLYLDGK